MSTFDATRPQLVSCHTPTAAAPAPTSTPAPVASHAPTSTDRVNVSGAAGAQKPNLFQGIAPSTAEVSVDGWKQGKNDSLEGILRNQGYSLKEIYTKDADGKTLMDRVASTNGLKDPNLIHPGQKLNVPSKEQPPQGAQQQQPGAQAEPARPQMTEQQRNHALSTQRLWSDTRTGALNHTEFHTLNTLGNDLAERKAQFLQDGRYTDAEKKEMQRLEDGYLQTYENYRTGDANFRYVGRGRAKNDIWEARGQNGDLGDRGYIAYANGMIGDQQMVALLNYQRMQAQQFGHQLDRDHADSALKARPGVNLD